ncbi:hypothetical protein [Tunturiibacter gelidoferens]|jgi:hypothetical protein|uniref:Uncharacterized protein n=1 Tax=Tunturiibacter gelidiferens TaxID=3069689 RepID=A0A9X0QE10_9BACT|nr:hypothetical protein [Edaphobacter lichenicola]MBB5328534.1 hypothetical protein [Edaphobacter lichenicola]
MKEKLIFMPLICLLFTCAVRIEGRAQDQHPILDQVANKVIAKYQNSTCQQLWVQKEQKAPPTPAEQRAIQFLKSDPQMRTIFINKVAAPIANKMFECGMIP